MSEPRGLGYWLGRAWLAAFGWKVEGAALASRDVRKAVVLAAPHTSAWDFPFTLAASSVLGVKISWLGKDSLFAGPLRGRILRLFGGIAVDHRKKHDVVDDVVSVLNGHDQLYLVLAPEGARGKAPRWKTGFYQVAVGAKVPVVLGYLDYAKKTAGFGDVVYPSGDLDADLRKIRAFYKNVTPKRPERMSDMSFGPEPTIGPGLFGQSPRWGTA